MTDWKALCAELAEQLDDALDFTVSSDTRNHAKALTARARAYLAQPEPAGPTDEELRDLWSWSAGQDQGPWPTQQHCFARELLRRWGIAPTRPIAVSERLPTAADCDSFGRCWWWDVASHGWLLLVGGRGDSDFPLWLPVSAIPLTE